MAQQAIITDEGSLVGVDGAEVQPGRNGAPVLYTFDFAYDTPGLAAGVEIPFDPQVGDYLLDLWVHVTEDWDYDESQGFWDVGLDGSTGMLAYWAVPGGPYGALSDADETLVGGLQCSSAYGTSYASNVVGAGSSLDGPVSSWRLKFTSTERLLLWVSNEGTQNGTPHDATTEGAATLYLLIASPVSLNGRNA